MRRTWVVRSLAGRCIGYAISGIELIHDLRKGRLILTALCRKDSAAPAVGNSDPLSITM
jgi:hypothetical protein